MLEVITDNLDVWTTAKKQKKAVGRGRARKEEGYGIKKLRELILELAVRGKLVPQDASDEPAVELLDQSQKAKNKIAESRKIRKDKQTYETNVLFEVPKSWEWTCVGAFCHVLGGKRVPRGYSLLDTETDYVYIRVTDMKNQTIRQENLKYIDEDIHAQISKYTINEEDVYVTIAGTIGAVGSVPRKLDGMNLTENASKLIFRHIDKKFIIITLSANYIQNQFAEAVNQMAQPKLSLTSVKKTSVAIPPLDEQHRIVAKVDELMALCDQLEQEQADHQATHQTLVETLLNGLVESAKSEANDQQSTADYFNQLIAEHFDTLFTTEQSIDHLKQTILQLAVMGKLVPQDPNDQPASDLLEKIAEEKANLIEEGKIKKQKALLEIGEDEKPYKLPEKWQWSRIGTSSLSTDYGLSEKTFDNSIGVPVLKMGDIKNGEVILGGQKTVSEEVEGLPELFLIEGDLLYNRTNSAELVGKTGVFIGSKNTYTFASYLIRIRLAQDLVTPKYLNICMNSPSFRETQINPHLKQQCGQANVNGTIMKNMRVPIPPYNEQHRIVTKVNELLTLCDSLKANLNQAQTTQTQLADTIVKQAVN